MNDREFVAAIRRDVLKGGLDFYHQELVTKDSSRAHGSNLPEPIQLYRSLNHDQREKLFGVINLAIVNTLSHILGIIDGTSIIREPVDFELLANGTNIAGDLQDLFLAAEEKETQS